MLTQEQQIFEQIKKANKILITFRKTWNGDSVASALAMYLFLKKLDKKVDIVAEKLNNNNSAITNTTNSVQPTSQDEPISPPASPASPSLGGPVSPSQDEPVSPSQDEPVSPPASPVSPSQGGLNRGESQGGLNRGESQGGPASPSLGGLNRGESQGGPASPSLGGLNRGESQGEPVSPNQGGLFSFLPSYNDIGSEVKNLRKFIISLDISNTKVSQIKYEVEDDKLNFVISPQDGFFTDNDISSQAGGFKYDLIIVLDTPDLESLGKIYDSDTEFFYQVPIINIDHHSGNEEFGQINHIELTAVATAEILFSLFDSYSRDLIEENIATCLLTGMISKTRSFKTPNVTPNALLAASQLISMGARREEIVNQLYRSRSINVLKLWGRVLARLNSSLDSKLVWSTLTSLDFTKTNSTDKDLNDVIDELIINIPQANVIVLIYEKALKQQTEQTADQAIVQETEDITTYVLVYSIKNIDSRNLIKEFNPGGTKNLAIAVIRKPVQEVEKEVISAIEERLSKLPI